VDIRRFSQESPAFKEVLPDPHPDKSGRATAPVANTKTRDPKAPLTVSDLDEKGQAEMAKLKKASEQIESIFVKDLLGQMRRGVGAQEKGDPMGEMGRDMMDQAVADDFGRTGGLGIGKLLYKTLSENFLRQEAARRAAEKE
jgi:hypothetical protein